MKYDTVVYTCRAQPPHIAHIRTMMLAEELADNKVIIVLGSSKKARTPKNPFTAGERERLIRESLEDECKLSGREWEEVKSKISFVHARDYRYNDNRWAAEVYSKCVALGAPQGKKTCLIGAFKDDSSYYLKMFPQWSLHEVPVTDYEGTPLNATDIRKSLFEDRELGHFANAVTEPVKRLLQLWLDNHPDGEYVRKEHKYIVQNKKKWKNLPYHLAHVTADAVVIKSAHILLVKRKRHPGKDLYALPGGFLGPDETVRECAIRELKEETKIKVDKPVLDRSIVGSELFDHPKRSERWHIITTAFLINLGEGPLPEVKGSDDASGAFWIPLAEIQSLEDQMFEDHRDIIEKMTSRF